MISVPSLIALGLGPTQAKAFVMPLLKACADFEINTLNRQAAFVAQCAHESGLFVHMEEDLYYRDAQRLLTIFPSSIKTLEQARALTGYPQAVANTIYANKNGNGNYYSGDGWRYRGRGPLQLTGRTNYTTAALETSSRFLDVPELVSRPEEGCIAAAWFFRRNRCNECADVSDIDGITRNINGRAMLGKNDRAELYRRALQAFR